MAALADLPMTPKVWATAVGALLPLFQLTRHTSSAAALLARTERAIQNIAGYDQDSGPVEATTAEVITSLVQLLQLPDFEYGQGVAAVILGSLAHHALNRGRIVEAGAFGPLLQLLLSSKGTLRRPAARAFSALSFQAGIQEKLIAAGTVAPLVQLLKSSSATEATSAAATLANIATSAEGRAKVSAAGAIAPLVHLLLQSSSAEDVQIAASGALYNICNDVTQAEMVAAGAVDPLAKLLKSSSTAVREHAVRALGRLCSGEASLLKVLSGGGIAPLVLLSRSSCEGVQHAAVAMLANLASLPASQAPFASAGAIPLLVNFLSSGPGAVREAAVGAFCNLCAYADSLVLVAAAGAIGPLIKMLVTPGSCSETAQRYAATVLHKLTGNCGTVASFTSAGAVAPLVQLLSSRSARAPERAVAILLGLAVHGQAQAISAAGGIPPLVLLLNSGPASLQPSLVTILRALAATSSDSISAMHRAGVVPLLDKLSGDTHAEAVVRDGASSLLTVLKSSPSNLSSELTDKGGGSAPAFSSSFSPTPHPPSAPSSSSSTLPAACPQHLERKGKLCWSCRATGVPLKKCSVCAVAAYCGGACQKADWKAHKGQCAGLKASAAACKEK